VVESEKSGVAGGCTTRETEAVCERVPLAQVIVKGYVPVGVVALVVTVIVDEPEVVTDAGLKLALAPAGNPLALNVTVPVKPPDGVTVAV
jgi:hypothetical protein